MTTLSPTVTQPKRKRVKRQVKLTDVGIRAAKPAADDYSISDSSCQGLTLRVTRKGVKTFAFNYRNKATGKSTWLKIGRYPDWSYAEAREAADKARHVAAHGGTPLRPTAGTAAPQKKVRLVHRSILTRSSAISPSTL